MKNERLVTLKKIHERIREVVKWVDDFWIGKCPACGGLVDCDSELRSKNFIRIAFTCEVCRYCAEITLIVKEEKARSERRREASQSEHTRARASVYKSEGVNMSGRAKEYAKDAFKRDYLRQGKNLIRAV
jgi:hypothetical protein